MSSTSVDLPKENSSNTGECRTGLPFFTRSERCHLRPNERNAGVRLTIQRQRLGRSGVRRQYTLRPCRDLSLELRKWPLAQEQRSFAANNPVMGACEIQDL